MYKECFIGKKEEVDPVCEGKLSVKEPDSSVPVKGIYLTNSQMVSVMQNDRQFRNTVFIVIMKPVLDFKCAGIHKIIVGSFIVEPGISIRK